MRVNQPVLKSLFCYVSLGLLVFACDSETRNPTQPATGSLDITTLTSGVPSSGDGYSYILNTNAAQPIAFNTTIHLNGLAVGSYTVQLTDLPDGCSLSSANPVTVGVTNDDVVAAAAFQVTCVVPSGTGNIQVITSTSDPATANYGLLVDAQEQGTVAANGTQALSSLPAGSHTVGVNSIPANCSLTENNPQIATVLSDTTVDVTFTLSCTAAPIASGVLSITATTTGTQPDGFLVSVDGGKAQPLGKEHGTIIINVPIGSHSIQLLNLGSGCVMTGANPIDVIVADGENVPVAFSVSCS